MPALLQLNFSSKPISCDPILYSFYEYLSKLWSTVASNNQKYSSFLDVVAHAKKTQSTEETLQ